GADRGRERRDPAPAHRRARPRGSAPRPGDAGGRGPGPSRPEPARPASRRRAAAGGGRQGARAPARGGVGRRADREPGPGRDQPDHGAAVPREPRRPDYRAGHSQSARRCARRACPPPARRPPGAGPRGVAARGTGVTAAAAILGGLLLASCGLLALLVRRRPLLGRVALSQALRQPYQSLVVVASLMIGAAAIYGVQVMTDSIQEGSAGAVMRASGRVDVEVTGSGRTFDPEVAA